MTPESKSVGKYFSNNSFLKLIIILGVFLIFLFISFYEWHLDTGGEINGVFPKPSRWNTNATCLVGNFLLWYGQNAEDLHEQGQTLFSLEKDAS